MEQYKDLSVLFVEDDPSFRNWFADVVGDRFGELRTAGNGEQALAAYHEHPCDLLITDLIMPGMDGLALCRAIRGHAPDMPIVLTSASLSRTMLVESMNVGVDGYILKPIDMEMVNSVLKQTVNRLRLRRQSVEAARFWRQTFDAVPNMIAVLDRDFKVLRLNRAAQQQLAVEENDVIGTDYRTLIRGENHGLCCDARDTGGHADEAPVELLGGYYQVTVSPLRDIRGDVMGAVHVAHDVTELKRTEEALRYTSTHDQLTGLFNRAYFDAELARVAQGRHYPVSIVIADVDGLKRINDTFGHAEGDRIIRQAARALQQAFRGDDVVARIGGDEFAAILQNTDAAVVAEAIARIRHGQAGINGKNKGYGLSMSLGNATADRSDQLDEALKLADSKMYDHKFRRSSAGI